jgi:hypothetical protein
MGLTVLCPAFLFNIDTLTLFGQLLAADWYSFLSSFFFLALDLRRRDSVRKTLKRRGNTVKEFSVLREFEI